MKFPVNKYCKKVFYSNTMKYNYLYRRVLLLIGSVLISMNLFGQVATISYSCKNISLREALEQISTTHGIRFAFDTERFGTITGTINVKDLPVNDFLKYLTDRFPVSVQEIDGTFVLTYAEKEKIKPEPVKINLNGYVFDKITGERLRYCNIGISGGKGATTNDLGFFNFELPLTDSLNLIVSYVGYQRLDTVVYPSRASFFRFELKPLSLMVSEVQVVSYEYKVLQFADESGRVAFNPQQTYSIPRIDENDLANALTIVPGVNLSGGQSGGISIRGSSASENLVLVDGIPVMSTNHLFGNMSVLNGKYIQQVFVSRGGFDASYGERVSGLVELNGRSARKPGSVVDLSANLLNGNLLGVVPISNKFSVTAAWRRSIIDQWQNYLFRKMLPEATIGNGTYSTSAYPKVIYNDLNLKASYHPSPRQEINLNFLNGNDFQERDYELNSQLVYRNERADARNSGGSFNWTLQTGKNWLHHLTVGYSSLFSNSINEAGTVTKTTTYYSGNNSNSGWGIWSSWKNRWNTKKDNTRITYEKDNSKNNIDELRIDFHTEMQAGKVFNQAGIGLISNAFSYNYVFGNTAGELPVDSLYNEAQLRIYHFFVKQKIDIHPRLNLTWGLRGNYESYNHTFYWQPRGSIEYKPFDDFRFQFTAGKYYQFLSQIRKIDLSGNIVMLWYLPNYEDVGLLKANHIILGGQYEKNGFIINIEGYYKKIVGKVNLFANSYTKLGEQRIRYIAREGEERNQGIDVFINYRTREWNHFLSYSLSSSEERYYGINRGYYFPSFDNEKHRLKINEIYNYRSWFFSASWNYGSGLPWLKPTNNWSSVNYERVDYFSQTDFSVVRQIRFQKYLLNAGISFLNIFNRRNTLEVNSIKFIGTDGALNVRSDLAAISFTPVFFLNIKYQ
jgi:ferric enterobactin receptor